MRFNSLQTYIFLLLFSLPQALSHELPITKVLLGYNSQNNFSNIDGILYGPLKIQPYKFYYQKEIFLIIAENQNKKRIYLAINCKKYLLNVADSSLHWKDWQSPIKSFETHIINDYCGLNIRNNPNNL